MFLRQYTLLMDIYYMQTILLGAAQEAKVNYRI